MSYCRKKKWFKLIAGGLIIGLLVACGQVGPLYLPEKSYENEKHDALSEKQVNDRGSVNTIDR